ncbi:hypothetical protein D9758_001222 [Tetrapyrgos nigripes]|uniref:DUF6593 domain-containing protein n=1 Tax=Tetrapyrgos nigripes TaxID=182062 RepID=A0A8H5GSA0_9AGAR|nr:hypothetical protein D9758_001222 [Tetrapyrgos nigripes]
MKDSQITMTSSGFTLHFSFPDTDSSENMSRTFKIYKVGDGATDASTELYRFHHPDTGLKTGLTTFHRQNLQTNIFEIAGQIDWLATYNCTVSFGVDEVHVQDLRKRKNSGSRSRRFKASGAEYKWKIAENDEGLLCVDSSGKNVATWSHQNHNLWISEKGELVLDRITVTCFLNLWFKQHGAW